VEKEINALIDEFKFRFKRDSVLRMNLAKALEPYESDAVFTQSPFTKTSENAPLFKNAGSSMLLHRETADTAFQYPFALNLDDCRCAAEGCDHKDVVWESGGVPKDDEPNRKRLRCKRVWTRCLLRAIGELANVSGNHARSLFYMDPACIIVRLTNQLCPGYEQYHFTVRRDPATNERIHESRLLKRLLAGAPGLPHEEFYIGGEIVEGLSKEDRAKLESGEKKVTLDPDPRALLKTVAERAFGKE
jgi:CRISPR-associated protein Cst2